MSLKRSCKPWNSRLLLSVYFFLYRFCHRSSWLLHVGLIHGYSQSISFTPWPPPMYQSATASAIVCSVKKEWNRNQNKLVQVKEEAEKKLAWSKVICTKPHLITKSQGDRRMPWDSEWRLTVVEAWIDEQPPVPLVSSNLQCLDKFLPESYSMVHAWRRKTSSHGSHQTTVENLIVGQVSFQANHAVPQFGWKYSFECQLCNSPMTVRDQTRLAPQYFLPRKKQHIHLEQLGFLARWKVWKENNEDCDYLIWIITGVPNKCGSADTLNKLSRKETLEQRTCVSKWRELGSIYIQKWIPPIYNEQTTSVGSFSAMQSLGKTFLTFWENIHKK